MKVLRSIHQARSQAQPVPQCVMNQPCYCNLSVWKFIFVKTAQPLLTSFTPPKARQRHWAFMVVTTAPASPSLCKKEWRRPVLTTLWLLGGFVCTCASYLSALAYWVVHCWLCNVFGTGAWESVQLKQSQPYFADSIHKFCCCCCWIFLNFFYQALVSH